MSPATSVKPAPRRIALFIPCLVEAAYPQVAEAVADVLARIGCRMDCPAGQTCCGQPAFNAGYRSQARKAALRFIETFEYADAVVSPSGSCVNMVRNHYPALFSDAPDWQARAMRLGEKTFEFSEYLVDAVGAIDVGARFSATATYHDSCHLLRGLGVSMQPRKLLQHVRGLQLIEMFNADRCCGFGGAFSIKYPEISTALVDEKVKNILASGADIVVGGDMGCLMNIEGRLRRLNSRVRTMHLAELLAGASHRPSRYRDRSE